MRYIDKSLKPFNTEETRKSFKNVQELSLFVDQNGIQDKQEFHFVMEDECIIFYSVFEYYYEG